MIKHLKAQRIVTNRRQVLIGIAALLLGSLVYLIDRPPNQTYFVADLGVDINFYNILPNLFGLIGKSLPSLIHTFSFILITAGLLSSRKKDYLIICLCWLLVDSAFELGQKFNSFISNIIPNWFAGVPFLENTENYFIMGTFDFFDLTSIGIGAVLAYFILVATMERSRYELKE